jgi:hypothetical protein
VATDGLIQQRLGEAPEDEAVKERLEREHGELLEEVGALIRSAPHRRAAALLRYCLPVIG